MPVEILTRGGQGGRRRTHRAAGAEAADAVRRRAGGGLPFAVGGRYQNRPASAANRLGRLPFLVVELASREALRRARPDAAAFARALPCDGAMRSTSTHATCRRPSSRSTCRRGCSFPGRAALSEDPATGSATAAAAALLADLDGERDGELKLRIGQGVDMGRPSLLLTRVAKRTARSSPPMSAAAACR